MASSGSVGSGAGRMIQRNANQAANSKAVELLARFGYATRGIVYGLIGWLALLAGIGVGGATTDRKGAINSIYQEPFGKVLLIVIIVGLVGYALWSFIRGLLDTDGKGTEPKGLAARVGYVGVGVSYILLAFAALHLVTGQGNTGKSSDQSTQDWTATLLKQPFGVVLVVIVGLGILAFGLFEFYQAYKIKFEKHLDMSHMSATVRTWTTRFGQFGLAARGVVFVIISIFLIIAAFTRNASQAKGLGGALGEVSTQPYGKVLLVVIGLGFIAYGIFSFVEARYRRLGRA